MQTESVTIIDADTRAWLRNRSDELAAANGCRFDVERGNAVCDWIESYCNLYEGQRGPMILGDWQVEATMRMFGWVRWSERLQRWIRRFTKASIFIAKKNGKSPTAAAWALYLLAGDSEPGNHVFFAAADGQQARIVAKHAKEMVLASPALSEEIDINLTRMELTHRESLSTAAPISSGDNRAARAKQGINGCVVIDEVHVVNAQFISESSIDKAGASRDEPFHIEVSTAGKDPDSYGKKQYDYGKQVECGDVEDQGFFFLCYEVPQDLTDEMLAENPVKWAKMANPTWGRIIQEDEILADYNRSKRSLADLSDWRTFRLNQWQSSASPWIRKEDWAACRGRFHEDDLAGRTCCAGLDLAITRDMSALALVFRWDDDTFRVLPYFFLPEAGVKRIALRVPQIAEWVAHGHIITTPGETTDYRYIRNLFAEKAKKFVILQLIFDMYAAEQVTNEMSEDTGVERLKLPQNASRFNEPTQNLERAILERKFEHNGNPVLTWQMGHVNISTKNGNQMPCKPEREDHKKIDGVVATIMGYAGARLTSGDEDWFRKGGGLRD